MPVSQLSFSSKEVEYVSSSSIRGGGGHNCPRDFLKAIVAKITIEVKVARATMSLDPIKY